MSDSALPVIFHLRRFALDDGPGIRTTVFLKGCPLACIWCHNPESVKVDREIAFYPQLCLRCGDCASVCPTGAIADEPERLDRTRCLACGSCADACPATALKSVGMHYPVDKLVELLLRDRIFYETSGGGVTFSGGEPTLHMDYLGAVLQKLKGCGIHTAIQTCGMFDLSDFRKKVLPYLDLIFYDLKIMDPRLHVKYTGKDNRVILQNFTDLMKESSEKVQPRVALVPGITATTGNVKKVAGFLKRVGCADCEALPYNPGGIAKRAALGDSVPPPVSISLLTIEQETRWKSLLRNKLD